MDSTPLIVTVALFEWLILAVIYIKCILPPPDIETPKIGPQLVDGVIDWGNVEYGTDRNQY